jgi:hypothetical protein
MKKMQGFNNDAGAASIVARALLVSFVIAIIMLLMTFGFMYIFSGERIPATTAIVLILFAISFISSVVLLDRMGVERRSSIIGGTGIGLAMTIFLISVICGVFYIKNGMIDIDLETLLTGFGVCLITGAVINHIILKF